MTTPDDAPRWRQVTDDLRRRILGGQLAPGARLPGRRQLIEQTGMSDRTVLAALHALQREGLVYVAPSSGWYVRTRRGIVRSTRNRLSRAERAAGRGTFSTDCYAAGLTPRVDPPNVITGPAPEHVAAALGLDSGAPVVSRERVMHGDDEVLQLATSYLPADLLDTAPAIAEQDTGQGGIYARLEDAGHTLTEYTERVAIGRADEHEARQMDLTPGDPVYRVIRTAWADDRPVEVNHITITGDRYELFYELPAT